MSLAKQTTPVLLTFNEEANIGRTLAALWWASDIVVVDSGSTDRTLETVAADSRVRVFEHPFESPGRQWEFAIKRTAIGTPWVIHLDADHVVTDELISEIRGLDEESEVAGFEARFTYCVNGKPLRGSLYPPKVVLFRHEAGAFTDDGHTHRLRISGPLRRLRGRILHDDRKELSRWFDSQLRYSELESRKLATAPASELSSADRIRRLCCVAPLAVFVYCLIVKGGLLNGRAGVSYAFQRMVAESMLALRLLERRLKAETSTAETGSGQ